MKIMRNYIPLLFCLLLAGTTLSCRKHSTPEPEVNNPKGVYLSFTVREIGNLTRTRATEGTIEEVGVQGGKDDGSMNDQRINNLTVLLFTKGEGSTPQERDANSKLKYAFHFGYKPNSYYPELTPVDGLSGPHEMLGGYYRTDSKLVDPGEYRAVFMANTRFAFLLYKKSDGTGSEVAGRLDIPMPSLNDSYAYFKELSSRLIGNIGYIPFMESFYSIDEVNSFNLVCGMGKIMEKAHSDKGHFAYSTDDDFTITPGYTSPNAPLEKKVSLERWLSKVEVTITNRDPGGAVYPSSVDYRLYSGHSSYVTPSGVITNFGDSGAELENYPCVGPLFTWEGYPPDPMLYGSIHTRRSFNDYDLTEQFLQDLKANGFGKLPEGEHLILSQYIAPYSNALAMEDADNTVVFRLIVENIKDGKKYIYHIPIRNLPNTPAPSYIDSDKYTEYTTLRNTLYRLRLRFKGPTLEVIDVVHGVQEYTPKEATIPTFE